MMVVPCEDGQANEDNFDEDDELEAVSIFEAVGFPRQSEHVGPYLRHLASVVAGCAVVGLVFGAIGAGYWKLDGLSGWFHFLWTVPLFFVAVGLVLALFESWRVTKARREGSGFAVIVENEEHASPD
jgi:hypothetical protein